MKKYVVEKWNYNVRTRNFFDNIVAANNHAKYEWTYMTEYERISTRVFVLEIENNSFCIPKEHRDEKDWFYWYTGARIPEEALSFGIIRES